MSRMAFIKFIPVVSCLVLPPCKPAGAVENPAQLSPHAYEEIEWKLLWADEFSADELDVEKWSRCQRGRPAWRDTMSDDPAPYLTAGITSREKFSFQYGKVQILARFKSALGAWPALWMMGTEKGWRAKGEIDLMEQLNFDQHVYQTVHSVYTLRIDRTNTPKKYVKAKINRDDWNTYGCQWDANQIVLTVNGKPTHTYPRVPAKGEKQQSFDQPFYLVLSMQIGGSWVNGSGPTDPAHYPAGMEVDWGRVFQSKQS